MSRYHDRRDAGRLLASALSNYAGDPRVVVLGLPRGGVPVAYEVASALGAPLDAWGAHPPLELRGRTVILVDDGLATGDSMRAAIAGLKQRGPARVVVAVPIAAASTCEALAPEVDDIICAATPEPLQAIRRWYEDFSPTTDEEVRALLDEAAAEQRERARALARAADPPWDEDEDVGEWTR